MNGHTRRITQDDMLNYALRVCSVIIVASHPASVLAWIFVLVVM